MSRCDIVPGYMLPNWGIKPRCLICAEEIADRMLWVHDIEGEPLHMCFPCAEDLARCIMASVAGEGSPIAKPRPVREDQAGEGR